MARTSRRFEVKKIESNERTLYKAGIYTRLSNERTEAWREKSSSIETQILNCKEYAKKENIKVVDIFTDYEYSGTNFNRPEFQSMMDAIKERRINCIIIRDLSRLGREYLEMGRLIDKVFPFLGVRFISVNDNLDTIKEVDSKKSFEVTIKNIINDMYSKDLSVKIKSSKLNRAKNGYFIGSVPPYGYKIVKEKEGQRLKVDENVRFIVEEMYQLTIQGYSQRDLARYLNQKGYATAMVYYKSGRIYRKEGDPQWHVGTLGKILTNEAYIGNMVQGIKSQNLAEGKKQRLVDKSNYIVVENTHEAIISKEDFEKVQKARQKRLDDSSFSAKPNDFERDKENRFDGLVFTYTGEKMYRRYRIDGRCKNPVLKYLFRTERNNGLINQGKSMFIMEKDLDERLIFEISQIIKSISSEKEFTKRIKEKYNKSIHNYEDKISRLDLSIKKEEYSLQKNYERYSLGRLDRDNYILERDISQDRIKTIDNEKLAYEDNISKLKKDKNKALAWIRNIFSAKGLNKFSSELIGNLVERVVVNDTHKFEIVYKFNIESLKGVAHE